MREHHLAVPRTARYFTLGDPAAAEVWFVLHGYGQLAARFLERFRALDDGRRLLVAPEGLSRFYLSEQPAERRVGATWMTREDRLNEIADYLRYLDALYAAVAPRGSVHVLGFSQGASTAVRWVGLGAARVDRLIVWGGEIPPDLELADQGVAGRLRAARLALVYGRDDEYFPRKIVAATEERLAAAGIPYEAVSYDGGHEVDGTVFERLVGVRGAR